jgi:fructokinase
LVRPSADLFQPEDLPPLPPTVAARLLHRSQRRAQPQHTFAAMERIKVAGGRVSFDPNIRADLWQDPELLHLSRPRCVLANVVKLSEELAFISGSDDFRGIARLTAAISLNCCW